MNPSDKLHFHGHAVSFDNALFPRELVKRDVLAVGSPTNHLVFFTHAPEGDLANNESRIQFKVMLPAAPEPDAPVVVEYHEYHLTYQHNGEPYFTPEEIAAGGPNDHRALSVQDIAGFLNGQLKQINARITGVTLLGKWNQTRETSQGTVTSWRVDTLEYAVPHTAFERGALLTPVVIDTAEG